MEVFRKPATAQWYYDSAQKVDAVEFTRDPWSDAFDVSFDGTKDKTGERHTTMRLRLSEADVERMYAGLVQGRKNDLRELSATNDKLNKQLQQISKALRAHLDRVQECWRNSAVDSDAEKQFLELRTSLETALEKISSSWKWSW